MCLIHGMRHMVSVECVDSDAWMIDESAEMSFRLSGSHQTRLRRSQRRSMSAESGASINRPNSSEPGGHPISSENASLTHHRSPGRSLKARRGRGLSRKNRPWSVVHRASVFGSYPISRRNPAHHSQFPDLHALLR